MRHCTPRTGSSNPEFYSEQAVVHSGLDGSMSGPGGSEERSAAHQAAKSEKYVVSP
jgi:hypothetical protein